MTIEKSMLTEEIRNKWKPVLEAEGVAPITDPTVKANMIRILENQVNEGTDGAGAPSFPTSTTDGTDPSMKNWDPILISLVRRTQPALIANAIFGVQPMSGPTGLIFSMKSHAVDARGVVTNDLYAPGTVPDPNLTGSTKAGIIANDPDGPDQPSMDTADAEVLGSNEETYVNQAITSGDNPYDVTQVSPWAEMTFTIDQASVTAESRAMKARYTQELAHDLKMIHGLDAETELANLLSGEIVAEQNREMMNTMYVQSIPTLQTAGFVHAGDGGYDFFDYTGVVGTPNTYTLSSDSEGRWEQEHYKNIIGMINRVSQEVALGTRRGLANFIVTSPVIGAALDMVSKLDTSRPMYGVAGLGNDNISITYAGRLLNRFEVYIDPYLLTDTVYVGYKGANAYDAGYYYCPYVPLTMMKAQGENDFQPRIGFKTRYGMTHNPFTTGVADQNWYFRRFVVAGV